MAAVKFYFHDATTTDTGTLPSTKLSGQTANVTATGASTNRAMTTSTGALQASAALTTLAQTTAQRNWFRRYVSAPLAAQTIAAGTTSDSWLLALAGSESSTNSAPTFTCYLGVWRPSTGALVGTIKDLTANGISGLGVTTVAEQWLGPTASTDIGTTTAVTTQDGDILVIEIWAVNIQAMATAYTNTLFYDGTTETSTTSAASYLQTPTAGVTFSGGVTRSFAIPARTPSNTLLRR